MHKIIVANYKMNGDKDFYLSLINKLNNIKVSDAEVILCPPFVYLPFFEKVDWCKLGAQTITSQLNKKSTGEISPVMLKEFGVTNVIVGHSERRAKGETDEQVAGKIKICLDSSINPIICVGEEDINDDISFLADQVKRAVKDINVDSLTFAYEPVWAIGTGLVPSVERINRAVEIIKKTAVSLGINAKVLYGGSVDGKNYLELLACDIDGFLCGGVSLRIDEFISIVKGVDNA